MWHFATSYLLHHQLSPNHQQQGLCAGAKPVWCRQSPPANKSWHLELVRREGAGQGLSNFQIGISLHQRKTRLKNVGQELGGGLMPGGWKQHGSVISGVTWWQLVFPMTWLHKDFLPPASTLLRSKATAQACQQPPGRQPHLKIAAALFSLTQKRAEILRGKGGKVEVFTNTTLFSLQTYNPKHTHHCLSIQQFGAFLHPSVWSSQEHIKIYHEQH